MPTFPRITPTETLELGFRGKFNQLLDLIDDATRVALSSDGFLKFYNDSGILLKSVDFSAVFKLKNEVDAPAEGIEYGSATEETEGVIKLATQDEALQGVEEFKAVSPATLAYFFANFFNVEVDTSAWSAGMVAVVKITPSGRKYLSPISTNVFLESLTDADYQIICSRLAAIGCGGGSQVTLPTFTLGTQKIEKAIVTPTDIIFSGPTTIREGQIIQVDAYLVYSDGSQTKITATGQRQSSAVDLLWDDQGELLALSNLTEGDTRTATLSITSNGITKSQQITIVDASSIVPNGNYRLTDGSLTEGGAAVQFKLQRQLTDNSWEDYPDPHVLRFRNPFPGLTIDEDGYAQCADGSITQNESRTLEGVIGGSQDYNVTLPSVNAAGTGLVYTADSTKEGVLTYSYSGCPSTGTYPAVLRYRSTTSAPIARISINGGASFDVQLAPTDGVLQNISLTLPLLAGSGTIRIEPIGFFAQNQLQINGTGSVDQVLATTLVPIQNVDPTPDPNTTQLVAYRFIKGGSVAGQPTDYIEVIMKDTYPESPMGIQLWLSSSSTPTSGYNNFEHKLSDGSPSTDGNRHAYWQNIGTLANKVFKLGITNLADGNAGNPSLFTFTIITTNASSSGFVQLYPV